MKFVSCVMPSAAPSPALYAAGYPAELHSLRENVGNLEPGLTAGLYALLRSAGVAIHHAEADVLSGHALQFLYSRNQPDCVDLAFMPPVDSLFRACHAVWREVTPSGPEAAFGILGRWIAEGRLCLARLQEPLLVYGHSDDRDGTLYASRLNRRFGDVHMSISDCGRDFWRQPVDEGNVLIMVESAAAQGPDMRDHVMQTARRIALNWHARELAGCAAGEAAYRKFAADLRDSAVEFSDDPAAKWTGAILWRQWTARSSIQDFCERIAPRFGGAERQILSKAAFHFGQCLDQWHEWARRLGPTWDVRTRGFVPPYPSDFLAHWKSAPLRRDAASYVDRACEWEGKAVAELTRLIH